LILPAEEISAKVFLLFAKLLTLKKYAWQISSKVSMTVVPPQKTVSQLRLAKGWLTDGIKY
jgi:hypothetical protein